MRSYLSAPPCWATSASISCCTIRRTPSRRKSTSSSSSALRSSSRSAILKSSATGTVTSLSRSGQSRWEPPVAGRVNGLRQFPTHPWTQLCEIPTSADEQRWHERRCSWRPITSLASVHPKPGAAVRVDEPPVSALGFFLNLPLSLPFARSPMRGPPLDELTQVHGGFERRRLDRTGCEPLCLTIPGPLEFLQTFRYQRISIELAHAPQIHSGRRRDEILCSARPSTGGNGLSTLQ
jgi:hypothetical protein